MGLHDFATSVIPFIRFFERYDIRISLLNREAPSERMAMFIPHSTWGQILGNEGARNDSSC